MDDDPVAIHTLAAASHEIIHTLLNKSGLRGILFDSDIVRDECRGELMSLVKAAPNFFKHADRDPGASLDFDTGTNEFIILFTAEGIRRLDGHSGELEETFAIWFSLHHPHLLTRDIFDGQVHHDMLDELRRINKRQFFDNRHLLHGRLKRDGE